MNPNLISIHIVEPSSAFEVFVSLSFFNAFNSPSAIIAYDNLKFRQSVVSMNDLFGLSHFSTWDNSFHYSYNQFPNLVYLNLT